MIELKMDQISEFVDERQKSWCIHCGGWLVDLVTNRDHVPSKSLLKIPYPENLPVIKVCQACNEDFSFDEDYLIAFLGSVLSGQTTPEQQVFSRSTLILRRKPALQARIEKSRTEQLSLFGGSYVLWTPEAKRIQRVILKNARGHAFYEEAPSNPSSFDA